MRDAQKQNSTLMDPAILQLRPKRKIREALLDDGGKVIEEAKEFFIYDLTHL